MEISDKQLRYLMFGIGILSLLVGVWMVLRNKHAKQVEVEKIRQVNIERGDTKMTITREGTLTVKLPEGTFQQQWTREEADSFFAKLESEDLSKFSKTTTGSDGYYLTLVSSGGKETGYFIPIFADIEIPEAVEHLIQTLEEIAAGSVIPTAVPTITYVTPTIIIRRVSPTPTQRSWQVTPTPTAVYRQTGGGNLPDYLKPFVCEFINPNIRPDVLSETVCTPQ